MQPNIPRSPEPRVPEVVEAVCSGATDPMLIVRCEGTIAFANQAAEKLFRAPIGRLRGAGTERFLRGCDAAIEDACRRRFCPPLDTGEPSWRGPQPRLVGPDGAESPVQLRVSTIAGEGEVFACVSIRMPRVDTQPRELPGRAQAERALERSSGLRSLGVIVVDIDHFQLVNESLGRASGNELLSEIGALLGEMLDDPEMLARLEGDRFALIVEVGAPGLLARAEKILEVIRARRFRIRGSVVRLTASAGCARAGCGRSGEDDVLAAETALRSAKDAGRDRCCEQEASTREQALATIGWTDRIRTGIEEGALIPHFQPILDLETGRVSHYELLARLRDDRGGLIQPGTFIPVAERLGLIGTIDRWAIETAVRTLASSPLGDRAPRIAVNASGRSVGSRRLLDCLRSVLSESDVPAEKLIVEVTETAAIGSIEEAVEFGDELCDLGVGFALDDFGAGFGTFYYLKHLPLDQVKIDGEFIRGIAHSASDQLFVRALVDMASGLGIKTVAEFVTDAGVLEVVRELGIDYAQGFHIGKPEPLAPRTKPARVEPARRLASATR